MSATCLYLHMGVADLEQPHVYLSNAESALGSRNVLRETVETDYYNRYWSPTGFRPVTTNPDLAALIEEDLDPAGRCLDFGCGDGRSWGLWLRDRTRSYVGVDVSETAVAGAKNLGLNAKAITDGATLSFEPGSFDQITCLEVLEHLFEPHLVVAELRRVLAPGGRLLVTVPNAAHWQRRKELVCGIFNPLGDDLDPEQAWRSPHIRFFTVATLRSLLEQAGFVSIEIVGWQGGKRAKRLVSGMTGWDARTANSRICSFFGRRLYAVAVA